MSELSGSTIAAIATAVGNAGVAIVRISGAQALAVGRKVFHVKHPTGKDPFRPRQMVYGRIFMGDTPVDEGLAVYMKAPHSYTGEDVFELQCHGGDIVANLVLEAVLRAGARLAQPGEFTKRAFLSGRIGLDQAEAVMGLIGAGTQRAAKRALRQLEGRLCREVKLLQERLTDCAAALETYLDYPDEDVEPALIQAAFDDLAPMEETLREAVAQADAGRKMDEGASIVLCGAPNAGKSTLLNALIEQERAIVTPIPGTTRDVLRERANLRGLPVTYSDTAGIRSSGDEIERIGVERAKQELLTADVALLVLDGGEPLPEFAIPENCPLVIALNKSDQPPRLTTAMVKERFPGVPVLTVSAKEGSGIPELKTVLYDRAVGGADPEDALLSNTRQQQDASAALTSIVAAREALSLGMLDCAALEIRAAYHALGRITGETADEHIIDRIFERFCLGK